MLLRRHRLRQYWRWRRLCKCCCQRTRTRHDPLCLCRTRRLIQWPHEHLRRRRSCRKHGRGIGWRSVIHLAHAQPDGTTSRDADRRSGRWCWGCWWSRNERSLPWLRRRIDRQNRAPVTRGRRGRDRWNAVVWRILRDWWIWRWRHSWFERRVPTRRFRHGLCRRRWRGRLLRRRRGAWRLWRLRRRHRWRRIELRERRQRHKHFQQ